MYTTKDDLALLEGITEGKHAAFSELVMRYHRRFYRLAYRQLGNIADAEDIVQECFLTLWRKPESFRVEKNVAFTTWFSRVVINRCRDLMRKPRGDELSDSIVATDTYTEVNDDAAIIKSALLRLPERQRCAVNLCYYEEYSNKEAASIMGVGVKAIESLLMRAKSNLRLTLQKCEGEKS